MQTQFISSIDDIPATDWNRLLTEDNPFLNHSFLAALEHHGAVGNENGWLAHHLIAFEGDELCGALPLYIKSHSYGEFVFDWAWANAYQRAGLNYYPKLVSAVPYTPVTGARLLTHNKDIARLLAQTAQEYADKNKYSSLHVLFSHNNDNQLLNSNGLLTRYGYQFHWHNRSYSCFEDFLSGLTTKHRKNIRRERKRVREQAVTIHCLPGNQVSPEQWQFFHQCYQSTFDKKSNYAALTLGFFQEIGTNLGSQVLLILAEQNGKPIASALFLRSHDTLYGRYWGTLRTIDCLHFELCYYQAIEYCINHGLQYCEAGAQGEHKISRGFAPVTTYSSHWIGHPQFRSAIEQFVHHEKIGVEEYIAVMQTHLPYR